MKIRAIAIMLSITAVFTAAACSSSDNAGGTSSETGLTEPSGSISDNTDTTSEVSETRHEPQIPENTIKEANEFIRDIGGRYELTGETVPYENGRWFGRTISGKDYRVSVCSGSSMHFLVNGCEKITLDICINTVSMPYYAVSIDSGDKSRFPADKPTVELPDKGWHSVDLYCDGLVYNEERWNSHNGYNIGGIDAGEGVVLGAEPKGRIMMFFGDSTTEGVFALGGNDGKGNSATTAYTMTLSERLGAVCINVGYGGCGIINNGFFSKFGDYIDNYANGIPADMTVQPDIIVISFGANDKGQDDLKYYTDYCADIEKVRGYYPDADIYVMTLRDYMAEKSKEVADSFDYVTYIEGDALKNYASDDGVHPNRSGAASIARFLQTYFVERYGEEYFSVN